MTTMSIDSASIYQLLPTLEAGPNNVTEWGWQTSLEVTCALLSISSARISPSPGASLTASGAYDRLNVLLSPVVSHARPSRKAIATAFRRTRSWIRRDIPRIQQYCAQLRANEANFQPWLAWSIRYAWHEHSSRLAGLFDGDFVRELEPVLGVGKRNLVKVLEASKRPSVLRQWIREQKGEDFEIARDAYVLSALFRGRFHDTVAELDGRQILHHPVRRGLLKATPMGLRRSFDVSAVEIQLAHIILGAAWKERGINARAERWASNLLSARNELSRYTRVAFETVSETRAEERAAEIARSAGIRIEPKWVERVAELMVGLGVVALTHFLLHGWAPADLVAGFVADRSAHAAHLGSKFGALAAPKYRLRSLARAGAGRVHGAWQ